MLSVLLACAISTVPVEPIASESVDLIEVNHFYDENGKLVFDQVIFYRWSSAGRDYEGRTLPERYNVIAWRLIKKPSQLPKKRWRSGRYECVWYDQELLRRVSAPAIRETWLQYDPELEERKNFPKERRSGLLMLWWPGKPSEFFSLP